MHCFPQPQPHLGLHSCVQPQQPGGHGQATSGALMVTSALAPLSADYFDSDFYLHLWNQEGVFGWWVPSPRSCQFAGEGWGGLHVTQPKGAAEIGFSCRHELLFSAGI